MSHIFRNYQDSVLENDVIFGFSLALILNHELSSDALDFHNL